MSQLVHDLRSAWIEEARKNRPDFSGRCANCGALIAPPKRYCNNKCRNMFLAKPLKVADSESCG